jgi:nitronate monooxygenase
MSTALLDELENSSSPALPFPLQASFNQSVKTEGVRLGNSSFLPLYAGQSAPLIRHRKASELMNELIAGLHSTGFSKQLAGL